MSFKTLIGYQMAFKVAMMCFEISKKFPPEEKYGLTSQIRRSSRSVCAQIGEGYRKRSYPKYFVSKLVDADGENSETMIWVEFAFECAYIDDQTKFESTNSIEEIGKLLNYMIDNPGKFGAV